MSIGPATSRLRARHPNYYTPAPQMAAFDQSGKTKTQVSAVVGIARALNAGFSVGKSRTP